MKTLVIIPAYNEEDNIESTVDNVTRYAPFADYLIVNDSSKDNTLQVCEKNKFNYISFPVNLGIGGGVQAGYLYAKSKNYDIAIQMDGDGQHDAKYIKDLIVPLESKEYDVVIGSRFINKEGFQTSFMRRVGITFLSWLIKVSCGVKVKDVTSGFRAVNKKMISLFAEEYAQDYPEPEAIVAAAVKGAKIFEVPVVMYERKNGTSSITFLKSIYYMIKVSVAIVLYRFTL